jgi:hypothetical protein
MHVPAHIEFMSAEEHEWEPQCWWGEGVDDTGGCLELSEVFFVFSESQYRDGINTDIALILDTEHAYAITMCRPHANLSLIAHRREEYVPFYAVEEQRL